MRFGVIDCILSPGCPLPAAGRLCSLCPFTVLESSKHDLFHFQLCFSSRTALGGNDMLTCMRENSSLNQRCVRKLLGVSEVTIKTPFSPIQLDDRQRKLTRERLDHFLYQMEITRCLQLLGVLEGRFDLTARKKRFGTAHEETVGEACPY
ncbi:unnamed protein product [Pleuronectes platessa]|uniref:Uncharacterized protein n=1 Tax=Pleuronectes platessa TaxID=8262 RepID=A0A9N7TRX7_PLEPL|nr:unnamed protein product [Pleuronectes platessa]